MAVGDDSCGDSSCEVVVVLVMCGESKTHLLLPGVGILQGDHARMLFFEGPLAVCSSNREPVKMPRQPDKVHAKPHP